MCSRIVFTLLLALAISACENIGKRTVFSALQEQSKYDCELSDNQECPRSPEVYDEYSPAERTISERGLEDLAYKCFFFSSAV